MEMESVERLKRDLRLAAATLSDQEARFLVDAYYTMQDDRKRAHNQTRALGEAAEPHSVIQWLADQSALLESEIKKALGTYAGAHVAGDWMQANYGIGPVISAGYLAHIDIKKAPTAGHIWRYAGLDPTQIWEKGTKRPWNASLKVLTWKTGQSFMKFSGNQACFYGGIYRSRKDYEVTRNEAGGNAEAVARTLATKKIGKDTDAYKHLTQGHLPPAQIDARARRYAVKLFLSHLQQIWWFAEHKKLPPAPYAMVHAGHAHIILPPHIDIIPGLAEALRSAL